jgi:cell division protein FtsB
MEAEHQPPPPSPQTDRFILWGAFLFLVAAGFFMYTSLREEQLRLAGLQKIEADRRAETALVARARDQGQKVLTLFSDNPEFVRDQARERLGAAAPDELVIRLEPGIAPGASQGRAPAPLFSLPPAE